MNVLLQISSKITSDNHIGLLEGLGITVFASLSRWLDTLSCGNSLHHNLFRHWAKKNLKQDYVESIFDGLSNRPHLFLRDLTFPADVGSLLFLQDHWKMWVEKK